MYLSIIYDKYAKENKNYIHNQIIQNIKKLITIDCETDENTELLAIVVYKITKDLFKKKYKTLILNDELSNKSFDEMIVKNPKDYEGNKALIIEKNKIIKRIPAEYQIMVFEKAEIRDLNTLGLVVNEIYLEGSLKDELLKAALCYIAMGYRILEADMKLDLLNTIDKLPDFVAKLYNGIKTSYEGLFVKNANNIYYQFNPCGYVLPDDRLRKIEEQVIELKNNEFGDNFNNFIGKFSELLSMLKFGNNKISKYSRNEIINDAYFKNVVSFIDDINKKKISLESIFDNNVIYNRCDDLDTLLGYLNDSIEW